MATIESTDATPKLRPAVDADLNQVLRLLGDLHLPSAGVPEWSGNFVVAELNGEIVGSAGYELYSDGALLRSVAVADRVRRTGLGNQLVIAAMKSAGRAGAKEVFLLTTTAAQYFPRFGFIPIERSSVPASVQDSIEFREACPASAIVMMASIKTTT